MRQAWTLGTAALAVGIALSAVAGCFPNIGGPYGNGCPAQDPAGSAADGSHAADARGAAVTVPVTDAGAGAEPRVR